MRTCIISTFAQEYKSIDIHLTQIMVLLVHGALGVLID